MAGKIKSGFMYIIIITALIIPTVRIQASQSRSSYFNKSYTLSGTQADRLVAVAQAQLGKTKSQLRYTEAWCADFVSDCANLAGLGGQIPFDGYCQTLYNKIKNAGGHDVSYPQKGDLVFYYCKSCSVHWCHVGIMKDSINSIEGNYDGKVSIVRGHYSDGRHSTDSGVITRKFVRPAYTIHQPSFTVNMQNNATISGTSYRIAGTVQNGGTYPWLHLYIDYGWVADTANNQYGNYAFRFDTTKYSNGKHLLGVKLTNEDGFDYTEWYTIYINNTRSQNVYYGDLDLNGKVSVTDLSTVKQAVVGKISLTPDEKKRADVNGDGKITSTDVLLIMRYINKEIDSFPVER